MVEPSPPPAPPAKFTANPQTDHTAEGDVSGGQLDMMQAVGGDVGKLVLPTASVVDGTRNRGAVVQARTARNVGELEMESWLRLLDKEDGSFRS